MWKKLQLNYQLLFILLLAFLVRLHHITNPVLDWHAFRQADTASVTREFLKQGIDPLRPRYLDLGNIQSGLDNPRGWRMVEFPIINLLIASILKIHSFDLVTTSRVVSVVFSLLAVISLYFLVKSISGKRLALWSAFIMASLPYSIFYSRAILPEPAMLAMSLLSLWQFERWLKTNNLKSYSLSLIALAIAFLLKPYVVFIAPVYLAIGWVRLGPKFFRKFLVYPYVVLATAPLLAWRAWIQNFPEGIPANSWLFNGNHIRLRPAWFRWLFWERISKLILGWTGLLLVFPAITKPINKNEWLIYGAWGSGLLAYFIVFATGNVQHDYYQVPVIPIISILLAMGVVRLIKRFGKLIVGVLLGATFTLGWSQVYSLYYVNHPEYIVAGQAVDKLTPKTAKVIAPAFGDTQFLFQTNRTGWPIGFDIDHKIEQGATHYISTKDDDETRMLESKYTIVKKTDQYTLIDLTKPKEAH